MLSQRPSQLHPKTQGNDAKPRPEGHRGEHTVSRVRFAPLPTDDTRRPVAGGEGMCASGSLFFRRAAVQELINTIVQKAGLSADTARAFVQQVLAFLKGKL